MQQAESFQYFQKRAADERAAAASARDHRAAQPHHELAELYDAIVEGRASEPGSKGAEDVPAGLPTEFTILP